MKNQESVIGTILFQTMLIIGLCYLCEVIVSFLPFALPSSVLAMFIILALLFFKVLKPEQLSQIKNFLLGNMSLFFVPAGVGIIVYFDIIKEIWLPLVIVIFVTTPLVFVVTGLTVQFIAKKFIKQKGEDYDD